ncbi:hypothetical protein U1Q18_045135 [Sarracenia purpurea var. burkii]
MQAVSNDIQRLQGRKFSGGNQALKQGEEDGFWRMISVFDESGYGHLSGEASLTLAKLQAFWWKSRRRRLLKREGGGSGEDQCEDGCGKKMAGV